MPPWWYDVDAGGGWLGASGSHIVDQVRSWLGEFVSVRAIVQRTADRKEGADDTFTVFASLAGDVQCVMQQCAGAYGPMTGMTRVAGSAGSVWIDDDGPQYADKEGSSPLEIESAWKLPPPPPVSDDSRNRFSHLELGPYTRLCETFLARIEGRPDPTPIAPATFADGVASMAVIDAIRASAAHGGDLVAVV
jgi:predicted dehydrogenase